MKYQFHFMRLRIGEDMAQVINFPDKEELKNYKLMKAIINSKETRNKKARKAFFHWFWRTTHEA